MNSTALKLTGTTLRGLLPPYGGPFAAPGAPDGVDLDAAIEALQELLASTELAKSVDDGSTSFDFLDSNVGRPR